MEEENPNIWKGIVGLIKNSEANNQMGIVLNAIKKDLIFDDGLLSAEFIEGNLDEIEKENLLNFWVLNQVIYNSLKIDNQRALTSHIEFQQDILIGTLLKKPSLFNKLFLEYIELIKKLTFFNNNDNKLPDISKLFYSTDSKYLKEIEPEANFKELNLENIKIQENLLVNIIKIMIAVLPSSIHVYPEKQEICTLTILECLDTAPIEIKNLCFDYMLKKFDENLQRNIKFYQYVMKAFLRIFENIQIWLYTDNINEKQIEDLFQKFIKFLNFISYKNEKNSNNFLLNLDCENEFQNQLFENIFEIFINLNECSNVRCINLKDDIIPIISEVLLILAENLCLQDDKYYENIDNILIMSPNLLRIFKQNLIKEIKKNHNEKLLRKISKLWEKIYIDLFGKHCDLSLRAKNENDLSNFLNSLQILNEILKLINDIEFELKIFQQSTSLERNDNDVEIIFIEEECIGNIINLMKAMQIDTNMQKNEFLEFTNFINSLIQNSIFENFSKFDQNLAITNYLKYFQKLVNLNLNNFPYDRVQQEPLISRACLKIFENLNLNIVKDKHYFQGEFEQILKRCFIRLDLKYLQEEFLLRMKIFLLQNLLIFEFFENELFELIIKHNNFGLIAEVDQIICFVHGNIKVYKEQIFGETTKLFVYCEDCQKINEGLLCNPENFINKTLSKTKLLLEFIKPSAKSYFLKSKLPSLFVHLNKDNCQIFLRILTHSSYLANHSIILENWTLLTPHLIKLLIENYTSSNFLPILENFIKDLQPQALEACLNMDFSQQQIILNIINRFSCVQALPEIITLKLFKYCTLFIMHFESKIKFEAADMAKLICQRQDLRPRQLYNWHHKELLELIMKICVSAFLMHRQILEKTLKIISGVLGYENSLDFIYNQYKFMVAMLLPYIIETKACEELLTELANYTKIDNNGLLKASFVTFYLLYIVDNQNESQRLDYESKCLEYFENKTGCKIYALMNLNKIMPKMLFYYHKNPKTVMETIRLMLLQKLESGSTSNSGQSKDVTKFIADRFLGVAIYFEYCLMNQDFEKRLQLEILLSLGEIIRFLGPTHITSFHFKILALLTTLIQLENNFLKEMCLDVWNIFISNVDVQILGPSLSRIVAALQPALYSYPDKVNAIYKFLIISNGNLLSIYVPELYFIETFENCSKEIKDSVAKIINLKKIEEERKILLQLKKENKADKNVVEAIFLEEIKFFLKQISHENIAVRINGLNYLRLLFVKSRDQLNKLILRQNFVNPVIELVLGNLMIGCRNSDVNLKLASGRCLGELGAIEPGYLRPNYSQQNKAFPLSINSDSFAIIVLKKLCKAYQFQKNTQYVDNFSLGIQEILRTTGICPVKKTKMDVWMALPERMRQIMEPFLTSCYTALHNYSNQTYIYPMFKNFENKTFIDWAFQWSIILVSYIQEDDTKHILNSLLPSIRKDNNILDAVLPYILVHSLQQCNNEEFRKQIFEEVFAILQSIRDKSEQQTVENDNITELSFQRNSTIKENVIKDESSDVNFNTKCAKLCLELIDFVERWIREFKISFAYENDKNFQVVEKFYGSFNKLDLAEANFSCKEYARSLKYLEGYLINENKLGNEKLQDHLSFLIKIFVELMDLDALEGTFYKMQSHRSTLREQILINSMTDKLHETMSCYEQLMKENPTILSDLKPLDWEGIVQCYLRLDTPETALLISQGIMNKLGNKLFDEALKTPQAEPLWRLGRYDELNELLDNPIINRSENWSIKCGQALLLYHNNSENFDLKIDEIRLDMLKVLKFSGTDYDSYHKGYSQITKLHIITEIEKISNLTKEIVNSSSYDSAKNSEILGKFFNDWDERLIILQPTFKVSEPFLNIRRVLLTEMKELMKSKVEKKVLDEIDNEIGKLWLKSMKLNREAGCYQQAHLNILNAERYNPNNLFIEKAKLLWSKGDQPQCFKILEEKIAEFDRIGSPNDMMDNKRLLYSEAKFLQAIYNSESMNIDPQLNIKYFQESIKANNYSEKCYVHLAQYYDKLCLSINKEKSEEKVKFLTYVMHYYGKSMLHGCEFMYESMPRLLSIWFECNESTNNDNYINKMNKIVLDLSKELPHFLWFTAFSQIISRICHPSEMVWKILKSIVILLIQKYPQHSLWMILPIYKSSLTNRIKRCAEIFHDKSLRSYDKLITDFNSLADKLIELTNMDIPMSPIPPVSKVIRQLPKLLSDVEFSSIMMPYECFMQITLPQFSERKLSAKHHNPFPNNLVYIKGIHEKMEILTSMQKPKKITIVGSDGRDYIFMLKPKDDLRKDFRLMEFNAVVKQYLHQDPQARQRRLGIRTYAVQPLNEECGIIEWVNNLTTFRKILLDLYKMKKFGMSNKELKQITMTQNREREKLRETFLQIMIPRHPPVFYEWFLRQFPNPHNWYQARTTYIRSTAVMSMVGYILGLGDRHGENILLDGSSGDIVHVDFNCLFNRAETFNVPEKVPFRLTHNMVHAMGPVGIEGPFRKCCEIVLKVLHTQRPLLMSVLKPFIYDPMVTWNKRKTDQRNKECTDADAITNVQRAEARLKGFVNKKEEKAYIPLSTDGVVNYVIQEATEIDNLAAMYIGWGAFY